MGTEKKIAQRRGTAAVELALTLPFLLFLIIGGLSFALQFHVRHCMVGASRAAARELAVRNGTQAQATAAAVNQLNGINATFTITFPTPTDPKDVIVQISVPRNQVSLGFSLGSWILSRDGNIVVQTTFRKET